MKTLLMLALILGFSNALAEQSVSGYAEKTRILERQSAREIREAMMATCGRALSKENLANLEPVQLVVQNLEERNRKILFKRVADLRAFYRQKGGRISIDSDFVIYFAKTHEDTEPNEMVRQFDKAIQDVWNLLIMKIGYDDQLRSGIRIGLKTDGPQLRVALYCRGREIRVPWQWLPVI